MNPKLRFHVITVFPEMITQALSFGVVAQALKAGVLELTATTPRSYTSNVHQTIDDRPFGGGDGMLMLAEPLAQALEDLRARIGTDRRVRVVHLSPRGRPLSDQKARDLAEQCDDLILIASRYAGVDQRFLNQFVDEEISIGDYVVSGGELPALILIDAVARQVQGVLGNEASAGSESFAQAQACGLEFPQFTRPREWRGREVPAALISGDHARVDEWKRALGILVTAQERPDLLAAIDQRSRVLAQGVLARLSEQDFKECGLRDRQAIQNALAAEGYEK